MASGRSGVRSPSAPLSWTRGDRLPPLAAPIAVSAVALTLSFGRLRELQREPAQPFPGGASVAVPTLNLVLLYPPGSGTAQPSSGRFGARADFMNGSEPGAFARLVTSLNAAGPFR